MCVSVYITRSQMDARFSSGVPRHPSEALGGRGASTSTPPRPVDGGCLASRLWPRWLWAWTPRDPLQPKAKARPLGEADVGGWRRGRGLDPGAGAAEGEAALGGLLLRAREGTALSPG